MKSLDDIGADLSEVFDQLRAGTMDRVEAEALFNGGGKIIKVHQLKLAKEIFTATKGRPLTLVDQQLLIAGDEQKKAS